MKLRHLALLTTLGLLAILTSLYTTSTGVGLGPDSYNYIATARSLLKGEGVRIPQGDQLIYSAHFPPLYAGMLALSSLGVVDPLSSTPWLNALWFGANLLLVGLVIYQLTHGSIISAGLGALLFGSAQGLLLIHAQVWSEPPFFFFALLSLLLLSLYLRHRKAGELLGAAISAALAFLVRYAGAVLVLAGTTVLLLDGIQFARLSNLRLWWNERLKPAVIFLSVSCAPSGLWMLYNLTVAGSLTDRSLSRHPVNLRDLAQGVTTVASWIFPGAPDTPLLDGLALAAIIAGIAGLCVIFYRSYRSAEPQNDDSRSHPRIPQEHSHRAHSEGGEVSPENIARSTQPIMWFILAYGAFLLLSLSLFDAQTSLDARILSPIYITCLILGIVSLTYWLRKVRGPVRWLVIFLGVVFTGAQIVTGVSMALNLHQGNEKGYTSLYWLDSKILKQVGALPVDVPIYSNGADVIYLLTGKPAIGLPREISPNTLKPNQNFEAEIMAMRSDLEQKNGVLVIFTELQDRRRYLPAEYELNELLPLKRVSRWKNEGTLYRIEK